MRIIFFTVFLSLALKAADFGYIHYETMNIGDDFQSIAVQRFLPKNSITIDREYVSEFYHEHPVHTIVNGWFMHTKDIFWYRNDKNPPKISWPPSSSIHPFFISIHFTSPFLPTILSKENLLYLQQYAPIGARDYATLAALQEKGIPSYFSGCLTLTLKNPYKHIEREKVIYAVDLEKPLLDFIQSHTSYPVIPLTHAIPENIRLNPEARNMYAQDLLDKYRRAKCVVTARLHAMLPCLAFKTPVLFVENRNPRLEGLQELARHCTKEELLTGHYDFDFNVPPENKEDYLPIRKNLIRIITDWVQFHSNEDSLPISQ